MYFLVPSLIIGLLSLRLPLLYSFVPAHESGSCICMYVADSLLTLNATALLIVNTVVFYAFNWIFLLLNILMLNKIRHIKDKLEGRDEMAYLIAIWTFFCLF